MSAPAKVVNYVAEARDIVARQRTERHEADDRIKRLAIALEFLGGCLPEITVLAATEGEDDRPESIDILSEMNPSIATPYAAMITAMMDYVRREYAPETIDGRTQGGQG